MAEHCCSYNNNDCLGSSKEVCYDGTFASIRACFASRVASGSTQESWYIAAECSDETLDAFYDALDDGGIEVPPLIREARRIFPFGGAAATELLECAIGTRPPSAGDAGTQGLDGRKLYPPEACPSNVNEDDAGFYCPNDPPRYPEGSCAQECLEGWQ